ncbi:receptor-type tyrosine-protein phosphatase eta isoform X3 [Loxodonta africana]|uniref:receptor-type tyrosine-protein phosphatase eta isoform X3 n=1 Tax=Loxodonta africana TaxID=9785 RepID=UPI0030D43800
MVAWPGFKSPFFCLPEILCTGDESSAVFDIRVVRVTTTEMELEWQSTDNASQYTYHLDIQPEVSSDETVTHHKAITLTGLMPGTLYNITITPEMGGVRGNSSSIAAYTRPSSVSNIKINTNTTAAAFSWQNFDNASSTYTYRLLVGGNHSSPKEEITAVGITSAVVAGLKPGSSYTVEIFAQVGNVTEGESRSELFCTDSSQVLGIRVVSINATSMNLTWEISDNVSSSDYTFQIQVVGETKSFNLTAHVTHVVIPGLTSSTLYNITVYPLQDGGSEGSPGFLQAYTPPGPVSDFRVTSVGTTEIGLAWSSSDSDSFKILIKWDGAGEPRNETTTNNIIIIGGLSPGTKYHFEIFPQGPNGTQGPPQTVEGQTESSAVFDIRVVRATTTEMELEWQSTDNASQYTYHLDIQPEVSSDETVTHHKAITLTGLMPGTVYNITITPEMGGVRGNSSSIAAYTHPVFDIKAVSISPTNVIPTWKENDTAGSENVYGIKNEVDNESSILFASKKNDSITDLNPAASYTFSVTPEVVDRTQGETMVINVTTEPNPVSGLHVTFMGMTEVALTWCNEHGTANCRMLFEHIGSQEDLTQDSAFNISVLKPGTQYWFTLSSLISDETQEDPKGDVGANNTERSPGEKPPQNHTAPADSSCHQGSQGTEVHLVGLKPGTLYKATIYSQAADGTEGQPQVIEFRTNSSQVLGIRVVSINATSMNLTWEISDNVSSSDYTYQIQVVGETRSFNLTAHVTHVVIPGLTSSTLYNITVYPLQDGGSEGSPGFLQAYTPPGPVSDFRVTSVSTTEIGLAWSSSDSDSFKILIKWDGAGEPQNETTTNHTIIIGGLYPGTKYHFEIFPQGPNGTQGPPRTVEGQTESSTVFDIRVVRATTTEMELEWQSTDNASQYTYHLDIQPEVSSDETVTHHKAITLTGLMPGTLYNITITPEIDGVRGNSSFIAAYTRPSSVSNIKINTNTTAAAFSWQNFDNASSTYTYRLLVGGNHSSPKEEITAVGITSAVVADLKPGSSYTVEIFAQVGNVTEGESRSELFCTDAAPVVGFQCKPVPKEPTLVLTWACPPGANTGFQLEVSSGAYNVTCPENCPLENGTSCTANVTHLNFYTSYNISITTLSCGKNASSAPENCITSVTDPPRPDESPSITPVSHNSIKVNFGGFKDSHGPIKAYAIILTTGQAKHPLPDVLKYTYKDFKNGTSDTYVTYLITTDKERCPQGFSEVLKHEIDVGNEAKTCGYFNGKLTPLGSYRASVAGFTHVVFNPHNYGLIDGTQSYVSFSDYSKAVSLPQDPGVICGAVFGCIFGALVIVAAGGFVFWRKRRKDAKNNEVSFSQIISKLIKVENFEAYFKKQQADSNCGFAEEYEDLKLVGISQPKYAAELAENRGKNRYNNVLPYDASRVKLSVQTHSTDDYINANYMPGYHSKKDFIATQGPLPNTLKDFWRMVWEKNVYAIVMLTKCVEQGRTKCEEYWPSKQAQDNGDITVAMTSEIVLPEWTIRDFTIKNVQTSESHPLRQFHFTSWPDHGVPDNTDLLIGFRDLVRDYVKQSPPETPILVHCSAGVGRTGTFIAIDRLIYQIEIENAVDVYGIVYDLRIHRPLMVQTEDQYVFLNQCVLDIIRSQKNSKVDLIYQNTTAMTIYENFISVPGCGKTNGYIA